MDAPRPTPTLVCIIGPPAAGKMTVGQELCRRTGFKMFYSHAIAELLTPYFPFGSPSYRRLGPKMRRMLLEEACEAGVDLVMTIAWRFDNLGDTEEVRDILQPYVVGWRVLCVELQAPLDVRLERNHSENRRQHKTQPWVTDDYLRAIDAGHQYNSGDVFPLDLPHLRVDSVQRSARETAQHIAEHFGLLQESE